jgi:hypothetical protein
MKLFLTIAVGVVAFIMFMVASFGLRLGSMHIEGFFAKEQANISHEVFKQGTAHIDGMKQELASAMFQYNREGTPRSHRLGIEAMLRAKFSGENLSNYAPAQVAFLNSIGIF